MTVHRPTLPLHVWDGHPEIFGGRDLVNGGTWLAVTPTGRFAFVTNFREVLFISVPEAQTSEVPAIDGRFGICCCGSDWTPRQVSISQDW